MNFVKNILLYLGFSFIILELQNRQTFCHLHFYEDLKNIIVAYEIYSQKWFPTS